MLIRNDRVKLRDFASSLQKLQCWRSPGNIFFTGKFRQNRRKSREEKANEMAQNSFEAENKGTYSSAKRGRVLTRFKKMNPNKP